MKLGDKDKSDTVENRGLRISCGATGVKTFYYRYTSPITGKLAQIKIGNYPQVSLASARVQLQILKQMRQQGRCPVTERKQEKEAEKQAKQRQREETILTVKDLVELYLTGYMEDRRSSTGKVILGARKPKGQSEARRTLYGDAVRVLGERPAAEITRKDVVALIMQIIERGANVQAGNVLRELSSAYEYAIGLEKFDDDFANPALQAKASLRQSKTKLTPQKGKRIFTDKELARFLQWLPTSAYPQKAQHIFRLTLWTGCRTGEICNIAWDDIDYQQKTVHIRQSKTDVERYVQLSDQAIAFLKELQTSAEYDHLFVSEYSGKPLEQKKLTEYSWLLRRDNLMIDLPTWTPHDLRRTVRTGLARLQCPSEVAEAILGHARSGIEGTYDLHSYDNECHEWLQTWANHLDGLLLTNDKNNKDGPE